MADDLLLAEYNVSQTVRARNLGSLVVWAGYVATTVLPPTPPLDAEVRERIVAERIPTQPMAYVDRTIAYFMQDPQVVQDLSRWLNAWNGTTVETSLADINSGIIGAFMPRFAAQDVSDEQVAQWLADHYPAGV